MKRLWGIFAVMLLCTPLLWVELYPSHATVNEVAAANRYTGNGSTTGFPYTFKIYTKTDLEVLVDATVKTVDTDYTVSGVGASGGGTVTFLVAPANLTTVTILRKQPAQQTSVYAPNEAFPSTRVEKDFDKLAMQVQQVKEQLARAWVFAKKSIQSGAVDEPIEGYFARAKTGGGVDWAVPTNAGALSSPVAVGDGGTGATTAAGAATNLAVLPLTGGTMSGTDASILSLDTVGFRNEAVDAASAGNLRRNATALTWHDGTRSEVLLTSNQTVLNPVINGAMDVWQRGTSFAAIGDNVYASDRFKWRTVGAGVVTLSRSTNVPTPGGNENAPLFNYSLEVDVTTADASIAATDTYSVRHIIEGHNWRHFAQRQVTVSFWVMSSKAGVHSFAVRNSGADRYYIAEYTINSANTWEWESVTVPASPAAGTWDYTTGIGAELIWSLACGSNFQGTVAAWTTGALLCSANQVVAMDSNTNFFRITGVKMELGARATPYQFVPFQDELARAKRYYQKSFNYATAPAQNAGTSTGEFRWASTVAGANPTTAYVYLPVDLLKAPTLVTYNPAAANAEARNYTDGADLSTTSAAISGLGTIVVTTTGTAGTAVNESLAVHWSANAEL